MNTQYEERITVLLSAKQSNSIHCVQLPVSKKGQVSCIMRMIMGTTLSRTTATILNHKLVTWYVLVHLDKLFPGQFSLN